MKLIVRKLRYYGLILVFCSLGQYGCQEQCIEIPRAQPPSGERKVLLEEFTGVRCVTCPQGAAEIANLRSIYGGNIIPVAIHAGFFAVMYSDSRFDFKTANGQSLHDWFGAPDGYPSAVINRRLFPGEQSLQLGRNQWAGYVAQELNVVPKVKIFINNQYNESNRNLNITVEVEAQEDLLGTNLRLTVLLKEDNIIDKQADVNAPGGIVPNYVHKYVLREMLTNFDGNFLTNSIRFKEKVTRTFNFTIPESGQDWWKPEDIQVVAFVTEQKTNNPGEVLNAEEKPIK